jgi:hypothetical protein
VTQSAPAEHEQVEGPEHLCRDHAQEDVSERLIEGEGTPYSSQNHRHEEYGDDGQQKPGGAHG